MKNSTIALEASNASFAYRIVRNPNGVLASNGKDHEWELHVDFGQGFEMKRTYGWPETPRKAIQRGVQYADELWQALGYQM